MGRVRGISGRNSQKRTWSRHEKNNNKGRFLSAPLTFRKPVHIDSGAPAQSLAAAARPSVFGISEVPSRTREAFPAIAHGKHFVAELPGLAEALHDRILDSLEIDDHSADRGTPATIPETADSPDIPRDHSSTNRALHTLVAS